MKYIMFRCQQNGYRTFCIFSESLTHSDMEKAVGYAGRCENQWLEPISAGFVYWENDVPVTHGRSESMDLDSDVDDALYIWGGESVKFMPTHEVKTVQAMWLDSRAMEENDE